MTLCGGDYMYYIKVLHRVPFDTIEWEEYMYFNSTEALNRYIDEIFNPILYDADTCFITKKGVANWFKGHLKPVD